MDRSRCRKRSQSRKLLLETLESRRVFAAFTPGNLLVFQVDTVGSAASPVSLIEYDTSGMPVQTIPVTSTGANALTLQNSTTEGSLNISSDGQMVTFGGYRLDAGSTTSSIAAGVARVIGKVGPNGVPDTAQAFTDGYAGDSFRSVATDDGTRFWLSGAGTTTTGGVRFVASPTATTTTSLTAGNTANSRQVQILNGRLYVSGGSTNPQRSVFQVGSGLPTSGDQIFTPTFTPGTSGPQYNSYYFADLSPALGWNGSVFDTMYTVDSNATVGTVTKWTYNGSSWFAQGDAAFGNMINIVGFTNGSTVTLYGTTKQNGGSLVTLEDDSGYNATLTAAWGALANPVSAAPTAGFRGITRVPAVTAAQLSIAATDANKSEGNSGSTPFTFTVTRTGPVTGASSATWTVNGLAPNAADGTDFVGGNLPSGSVSFAIGELSKTVTVLVNGDLTSESTEGFTITLSSPVGATLGTDSAIGSIVNDDASTQVSIAATDANKPEGNAGTTAFTFTVIRSGVVAGISNTLDWAVTGNGSSQALPFDFDGNAYPSGQITFAPGETTKTISVLVSGETTVEPDEGFKVTISNITGTAAIIGTEAIGSIVNDDSTFAISPATLAVGEGNSGTSPMTFTVTRTGNLTTPSNIAWSVSTSSASAASANDFVGNSFPSGVVNFLANELTKSIVVNVQGDTTLESDESFSLTLDSATDGTIVSGTAIGVILNDEFQSLSAGDIVITALYGDNPDVFTFVPLVDLQPNTSIVFTDNAWNGTALLSTEGTITYTAPATAILKGTRIVVEFDSTTNSVNILAGGGTAALLGNFGISTGGDSLLAYTGLPSSPNFLFSVTTWGEYSTSGTPNANQTYLPSSLTVGSTAVGALGIVGPPAAEVDNGQYNSVNGLSGTPSQIRAMVANSANWDKFNGDVIDPLLPVDNANFSVNVPSSGVVNRQIFYNRSTSSIFGNGSGNPTAAIDSSKSALLPGGTASFNNYSNYSRGLNGLIVDIAGLVTATSADFQFATWNGIGASGFVATSASPSISVLPGAGLSGASRVKIEFPDNAIRNTWLRVTVLANANTALTNNDVFYFGNAVGDVNVGNLAGSLVTVKTNEADATAVRKNQSIAANSAGITNIYDINKDGRVNAIDTALVRQSQTNTTLRTFTAPLNLRMAGLVAKKTNSSAVPAIEASKLLRASTAIPNQNRSLSNIDVFYSELATKNIFE